MTGLHRRLAGGVVFLALILQACVVGAAPLLTDTGKAELTKFTADVVARGMAPGLVVLIVSRDGVLYEGVAGRQDAGRKLNMSMDSVFRIASMTKPLTSVGVMMLVEEGKLKLDDPVVKYLPGFDKRAVIAAFNQTSGRYTTRPAARAVTIRHLLTHTTGLGYAFSDPVMARLVTASGKSEIDQPLLHDPGAKWTYGPSTYVLGRVIEKVSGQPLETFLRERIFTPLDMSDTGYAVPRGKAARVVTIASRVNGAFREQPNTPLQHAPPRGDSGLYSTARDYSRFLQMLLNGGSYRRKKLLEPATVEMMGENQIGALFVQTQPAAAADRTRPFPLGAGKDKFGLGFQIQSGEAEAVKLRSPGSLSWTGIYNTHFWLDPKRRLAAIVLMQLLPFYDDDAIKVLRGVEQIVYSNLR
jgi:methyl acetate hydrolase